MRLRLVSNERQLQFNELAANMANAIIKKHVQRTTGVDLTLHRVPIPNDWINFSSGSIYVRHMFFNTLINPNAWTLGYVLANISLFDGYRGCGIFSNCVNIIAETGQPIIIENVIEPRFRRRLHYLGFKVYNQHSHDLGLPSYIRTKDDEPTTLPFFQINGKHYWWTRNHIMHGPYFTYDQALSAFETAAYLGEH